MELDQGDSIEFFVNNLPTDQNYIVYFAVQDENRNQIGEEIPFESKSSSTVTIKISGRFTDLLTVSEDSKNQRYYYGIKICSEDGSKEETLLIGGKKIGDLNIMTVYPRKAKGI